MLPFLLPKNNLQLTFPLYYASQILSPISVQFISTSDAIFRSITHIQEIIVSVFPFIGQTSQSLRKHGSDFIV